MPNPILLPCPRSLEILRGTFTLLERRPPARRDQSRTIAPTIRFRQTNAAPNHPDGYTLTIIPRGIVIDFRETGGLRAAAATLRQLLRQYGRHLPCLRIRDWPDFPRRGVMLDVSRGRVPKLETLLELVERLADFKINELQLYTEHTFAYRQYKSVWQSWGALTGAEIRRLDARCRQLGIDLVPNQNSFGHLRYFLEHPRLKKLAEVSGPYEDAGGGFIRRPTTLAPNHPGTLPFLRGLYDEMLPNFSSRYFNVGCDETWDLGRGRSKRLCEGKGQGRVYLEFLKQIHREVSRRGRTMMFWGDIILKYPGLIRELANLGAPSSVSARTAGNLKHAESVLGAPIALNWGYEANHPFEKEAGRFAGSGIPFYVCPGTSTWQTLIGRHDNALANLSAAAKAGRKHGAIGYLIADWGDGGHPQPLAVSWPMYLAGASLAWNASGFDKELLQPVLSRDVFDDASDRVAGVAFKLGFTHRKLKVKAPNETPLGTVIAAPPAAERELFCRNGLNWFKKVQPANIRAALKDIERQRAVLKNAWNAKHRLGRRRNKSASRRDGARRFLLELDLAARMAAQSCKYMLWQQAEAAGKVSEAKRLARIGVRELQRLEKDFNRYWPLRNKATPKHCSSFFQWRIHDYQRGL